MYYKYTNKRKLVRILINNRKNSTFAERLRYLLEFKQLSQAELSRQTGVSKSSITHYLKGDWEAKQDVIYSIASVMLISEAWLMGYDVPMERTGNKKTPAPEAGDERADEFIQLYRSLSDDHQREVSEYAQILSDAEQKKRAAAETLTED